MKTARDLAFMAVITTVCTVVLFASETLYRQQQAADPTLKRRTVGLLPDLAPAAVASDPAAAFDAAFIAIRPPGMKGAVFVARHRSEVFVREQEGAGLWGKITLLIAYDAGEHRLLGLDVLAHTETPGLGARIEEPGFRAQFRGMLLGKGARAARIRVRDGEFDAITGATQTSRAVAEIIDRAVADLRKARVWWQEQAK